MFSLSIIIMVHAGLYKVDDSCDWSGGGGGSWGGCAGRHVAALHKELAHHVRLEGPPADGVRDEQARDPLQAGLARQQLCMIPMETVGS